MSSTKLSIVIGTFNRLEQLKRCIDSIFNGTTLSVKVYVTDAGSTDGTIEYLRSIESGNLIPLFVGEKIGQAKAYNGVFKIVDTPFVCWLSDDNEVVNSSLDIAVEILEANPSIGLVGLKIKDVRGPFIAAPYIGGISSIGILNVNQGVLPSALMKRIGGFSEEFLDYGIDPDLTAKILFEGYKIVYTKKIALLHHRNWNEDKESEDTKRLNEKHKRYYALYEKKYSPYSELWNNGISITNINRRIKRYLVNGKKVKLINQKKLTRDIYNIVNAKYISLLDIVLNLGKKYHLVQSISKREREYLSILKEEKKN